MKKILAILLALIMLLSLTACGEKDNNTDANNNFNKVDVDQSKRVSDLEITDIKLNKKSYDVNEPIAVTVSWTGTPDTSAWIGIVPANVKHGNEEENDAYDVDYRYLIDCESGKSTTFETELEPGEYTIRVNEADDGGVELAWIGFTVNGSNNSNENDSATGTAIGDIDADNWEEVIAENYGLELSLPDGWSVKEAKSPNGATNITVHFAVGGDATYESFGETIFAELKKDASGDISKYAGDTVYATFQDAAGTYGIASFVAKVDGNSGKTVQINYFDNGATVELSLLRMGNWE